MDNKEKAIYDQISEIAKRHQATKIVLFGSRARKANGAKSDIDLAVYGCANFRDLWFDLQENVHTLLEFDLVNMDDRRISVDLAQEIERDGIVLYEKI